MRCCDAPPYSRHAPHLSMFLLTWCTRSKYRTLVTYWQRRTDGIVELFSHTLSWYTNPEPIYPLSPTRASFGIILIFFNTAYRDEGIDQLRIKTTTINHFYPKTNTTTLLLTYRDHFLCQLGSRRMMYWSRSGIVKYMIFSLIFS